MSPTAARDAVLLVTHSGDHFTVDRVAAALKRRGARPFRLDTDLFPEEVRLSSRLGPGGPRRTIRAGRRRLDAEEVRAVWMRRVWPPRLDERLDARFRGACARESQAALEGFLGGLSAARRVNEPARDREAEDKLRQLELATASGLEVPRTLVTNDADEARAFFDECAGRVVAKLLRPLSVSMNDAPFFLYTSEVKREDLDEAETLRHSPVVFQELVEKELELRVACVGGRLFAGAIDARHSGAGRTDWRRAAPAECAWQPCEVPAGVGARLSALAGRLGLVYGAADLILTPDGRHVFLEINPAGEWGMLERDLGLDISGALADALLDDES
ncbi:MAG TPA: hypothetical protein VGX48_06870 [Pyrinomonadaceae bacterium]|jgi:MvdC family ATP-grasp ribosomal peptide maturase|nr:hypothetical protein [Pyrinomonadaceae bacterium]